jgi:RHS repeat-associated protein
MGQQFDEETGLHYNNQRDYDPITGRYLQSDPIGLAGGVNAYAYTASNPLKYVDPRGEAFWIPILLGIGFFAADVALQPEVPFGSGVAQPTSTPIDPGVLAGTAQKVCRMGANASQSINPNSIRFSQSSVNGSGDLTKSMQANGWKGDAIDVVKMGDGGLTTIDNTRVLSASRAGVNVQANIHNATDSLPANFVERFTTRRGTPSTWGDAVQLRIGNQNSGFRNTYPNGSPYTGSID